MTRTDPYKNGGDQRYRHYPFLQLFIVAIFTVILKETLEADLKVEGPLTTSDLQKI